MKVLQALLVAATTNGMSVAASSAADDVVVVYDASGSMWGQIDGVSKIEIARDVMADLVDGWSDATNLGLVAYGHRSEGDCRDIETLIEPGQLDRARFVDTINAIRPKGKTPISAAVEHAADLLSYRDNPATVVLISDGVETCQADPCALAGQLARQGVKFTAHVVGFDLEDDAHQSLACIAENTGGVFVPARNAAELKDALAHVQEVVDLQPMADALPEPEPEPQVEADIGLSGPEQVMTGAVFDVSWAGAVNGSDFISIVPADADVGTVDNHIRVKDDDKGRLTAPGAPGLYELRYVLEEGRRTLASVPVEVVEAEVSISGPGIVRAGTDVDITWSATINGSDFITIVPAEADEGKVEAHIRTRDATEGRIKAPEAIGLYEIRYVLEEGRSTLASAPLEVLAADAPLDDGAGLDVPASARPGDVITISWKGGSDSADQRISLARVDQPDFSWIAAYKVGADKIMELKIPEEPGRYEVRFLDISGRKVLGRAIVEVK